MKLLQISRTFSGTLGGLARYVAARKEADVVFMAERWPRESAIPCLRKVRIQDTDAANSGAPESSGRKSTLSDAETFSLRNIRTAIRTASALQRLRKGGYAPDVIYATADEGFLLYALDVFPKARLVVRTELFYNHQSLPGETAKAHKTMGAVIGRLHNCLVLSSLCECSAAITSSQWQRGMFAATACREKLQVINNGVDTDMFSPGLPPQDEVVTFSCQGTNPARGIATICASLPMLLERRPRCRARIVSFASAQSDAARQQHAALLETLLPPLSAAMRQRVEIVVTPSPGHYVQLLRESTVYVYLTAPTLLSAGILEAMSCGVLTIGSDTGPVREILRHGENGFLCDFWSAQELARTVDEALENAPRLDHVRRAARADILLGHDLKQLLPRHAALVLGT